MIAAKPETTEVKKRTLRACVERNVSRSDRFTTTAAAAGMSFSDASTPASMRGSTNSCATLTRSPSDANALRSERRSEEHTSELQSRRDLVCRLLLEKKK